MRFHDVLYIAAMAFAGYRVGVVIGWRRASRAALRVVDRHRADVGRAHVVIDEPKVVDHDR
jgi:hypothetical protein